MSTSRFSTARLENPVTRTVDRTLIPSTRQETMRTRSDVERRFIRTVYLSGHAMSRRMEKPPVGAVVNKRSLVDYLWGWLAAESHCLRISRGMGFSARRHLAGRLSG